jgi:hypothetical protein
VGLASVRYDPKNPPNSIVVSEQWSGLRVRQDFAAPVKGTPAEQIAHSEDVK